jgi:hypothetical protein
LICKLVAARQHGVFCARLRGASFNNPAILQYGRHALFLKFYLMATSAPLLNCC